VRGDDEHHRVLRVEGGDGDHRDAGGACLEHLVAARDDEVLLPRLEGTEERLRGAVVTQAHLHTGLLVVAVGLGEVEGRELDVGGVGQPDDHLAGRSEERRVGKECRSKMESYSWYEKV